MPIRMQCPECQRALNLADRLAGKAIRCPKCQAVCRVPGGTPARMNRSETPAPARGPGLALWLALGGGGLVLLLGGIGGAVLFAAWLFGFGASTTSPAGPVAVVSPSTEAREKPPADPPAQEQAPPGKPPDRPRPEDTPPEPPAPRNPEPPVKPIPEPEPPPTPAPRDQPDDSEKAPEVKSTREVRFMPGNIAATATGGAGRYLVLHLPRERRLAVFDVLLAHIVRYIPLTSARIAFTAGQGKIVVALTDSNVLERWDLATGKRELAVPLAAGGVLEDHPLPAKDPIRSLCMGSASQGPILVATGNHQWGHLRFVDLQTLQPIEGLEVKKQQGRFMIHPDFLRASADGKTFAGWEPISSPRGMSVLALDGKQVKVATLWGWVGHARPGPDGKRIFTAVGVYDSQNLPPNLEDRSGPLCVPAAQGEAYLQLNRKRNEEGGEKEWLAVYLPGKPPRPVLRLPDIEAPASRSLWADRRIHFLSYAGRVAVIPSSSDRIVLHTFDLPEALAKSGTDSLLVTSRPTATVARGAAYAYTMAVHSKKGEVKYRLDSGPPGMKVSAAGRVTWAAPANLASPAVEVVIGVRDDSGQEIFHAYKIRVEGAPLARGNDRPGPKQGGEPPSSSGIKPPVLAADKVIKKMPAGIVDLAVGGGGRYLVLLLAGQRKLGIFDVNEARIVRSIPVPNDMVYFTAGQDKVVVALPNNVLERWDLATGKREQSSSAAIKGKIGNLVMGSASQGPVLVLAEDQRVTRTFFLDLNTFEPLKLKNGENGLPGLPYANAPAEAVLLRASVDGKVFGLALPPSALHRAVLVLAGDEVQSYIPILFQCRGHLAPEGEGRLVCTEQGLCSVECNPFRLEPDNTFYVPALQPGYLLGATRPDPFKRGAPKKSTLAVYLTGSEQPLATLPQIEAPLGGQGRVQGRIGSDLNILFIPDARLIVVLSNLKDSLELHRFDPLEALEQSGTDYLLITSQPPRAARAGAEYRYQVRARSKKSGVKYHLEYGPEGMTMSSTGLLRWKAPLRPPTDSEVLVRVTDAIGQERYQSFTVAVTARR